MEGAPQGFIHQVATLHQKIDVYSFRYIIFRYCLIAHCNCLCVQIVTLG